MGTCICIESFLCSIDSVFSRVNSRPYLRVILPTTAFFSYVIQSIAVVPQIKSTFLFDKSRWMFFSETIHVTPRILTSPPESNVFRHFLLMLCLCLGLKHTRKNDIADYSYSPSSVIDYVSSQIQCSSVGRRG